MSVIQILILLDSKNTATLWNLSIYRDAEISSSNSSFFPNLKELILALEPYY
jgi:hypothetical protein